MSETEATVGTDLASEPPRPGAAQATPSETKPASQVIDLPGPLAGDQPVESAPVVAPEHDDEDAGEGLRLTPKAVKMVCLTREEEGLDPSFGLRVAVRGGGCSGFEYALDFEEKNRDTDHVIDYGGLKVFVDPVSSRYLAGTTIDYTLGVSGTGFKFSNPQATGTCGCGSSFAV